MSSNKFTPGPWSASKIPDRSHYVVHGGNDALPVADVRSETGHIRGTRGSVETFANARLIAAAPDLLSAAQTVLAGLHRRINEARVETPVFEGIAALSDAIAKATGE